MSDTPERLAERLLVEGEKTISFFQGLSPEQREQEVYTEGSCWKVLQVLAHFAASEASMARLIRNILSGGAGTPEDFDLDAYNNRKVSALEGMAFNELLNLYADRRRETAVLAREMDPADLAKEGRHPFLGMAPLVDILKLVYRHNAIHLRDVRRAIA